MLFGELWQGVLSFPQSCISLPSTSASSSRAMACMISITLMWSSLFLHLGSTFRNSALCDAAGIEWRWAELLNWLFSMFSAYRSFPGWNREVVLPTLPGLDFDREFVRVGIALNRTVSSHSPDCTLKQRQNRVFQRLQRKKFPYWTLIAATSLLFFKPDVTQYDLAGVGTRVLVSVSHHLLHSSGQEASPVSAPAPCPSSPYFADVAES